MPALTASPSAPISQDDATPPCIKSRKRSAAASTSKGRPKPYACTYAGCSLAFHAPARLAEHARRHTGERPFVCAHPGCAASFNRTHHLNVHARVHANASTLTAIEQSASPAIKPSLAPAAAATQHAGGENETDGSVDAVLASGCRDALDQPLRRSADADGPQIAAASAPQPAAPQRSFICSAPKCRLALWTKQHLKRHESTCDKVRALRLGNRAASSNAHQFGWDATSTEAESDVGRDERVDMRAGEEAIPDMERQSASDASATPTQTGGQCKLAATKANASDAETTEAEVMRVGDSGRSYIKQRADRSWLCKEPDCAKTFRQRKHLRAHLWAAHSATPHLSPHISNSGFAADAADAVDVDGKVRKPFPCRHEGCPRAYLTAKLRASHEKIHQKGRYVCVLPHEPGKELRDEQNEAELQANGSLAFNTWSSLQRHIKAVHPPTCHYEACGRTFGSAKQLKKHLSRHTQLPRPHRTLVSASEAETDSKASVKSARAAAAAAAADMDVEAETSCQEEVSRGMYACTWTDTLQAVPTTRKGSQRRSKRLACRRVFRSARARDDHVKVFHLEQRDFACVPECGKKFGYAHLLSRHRKRCKHVVQGVVGDDGASTSRTNGHRARAIGSSTSSDDETEREAERHAAIGRRHVSPSQSNISSSASRTTADERDMNSEEEDAFFRREGGAVPESHAERGRAPVRKSLIATGAGDVGRDSWRAIVVSQRKDAGGSATSAQLAPRALAGLLTGQGYEQGFEDAPRNVAVWSGSTSRSLQANIRGVARGGKRKRDERERESENGRDEEMSEKGALGIGMHSKKRIRGRVLCCPYEEIRKMLSAREADDDSAGEEDGGGAAAISAAEPRAGPTRTNFSNTTAPTSQGCQYRFSRLYDVSRHLLAAHDCLVPDRDILLALPKENIEKLPMPESGRGEV
ncbi:FOG: Zn-finger [Ceraceosorus bombacis]|uniref:FOG: Zn-finger n=1 Tax=Ceraceosorus bombacis TaxID=401625 RepID=A0A0P1BSR3_9BASI|nr:FOG: Zn-finger [Ceraceosorus bombacis]